MTSDGRHIARCSCGGLSVTVAGAPEIVTACNCQACQRRTGGPFGLGAYYPKSAIVSHEGEAATYARTSDAGRQLDFRFCPVCGTTVWWTLEMRPDHVGIAVGCFGDPEFAAPNRVVWTEHQHAWLSFPDDLPSFPKAAS